MSNSKFKICNKKWNWSNFKSFIKFERNSNDAINVLDSLLLTYVYVSKHRKAFENDSSASIKCSKTQLSKMIESGGVICDISAFANILLSVPKKRTDIAGNLGKDFLEKQIDRFNKEYITGKCSEAALTKMEMKNVKKIINFLENRAILLKGATTKVTSQERGFHDSLKRTYASS